MRNYIKKAMIWLCVACLCPSGTGFAETAYKLIVPEIYQKTGTLPVYRAEPVNQLDHADPVWFNDSGVVSAKNIGRRYRSDEIVFADAAVLGVDSDFVVYMEYGGTYELTDDDGGVHVRPRATPATAIFHLGEAHYWQMQGFQPYETLESTTLSCGTLEDAQAQTEELLSKLGLENYELVFPLDMSVERIHRLGKIRRQQIESGRYFTDDERDFSLATADDEGFVLIYQFKLNGAQTPRMTGRFFVDKTGIAYCMLVCEYRVGELVQESPKLLTPEEAMGIYQTKCENVQRGDAKEIKELELIYQNRPAKKKRDGMLFEPVWRVTYGCSGSPSDEIVYPFCFYVSALDGRFWQE